MDDATSTTRPAGRRLRRHAVLAGVASCGDLFGQLTRRELRGLRTLPPAEQAIWLRWCQIGQRGYLLMTLAAAALEVTLLRTHAPDVLIDAGAVPVCALALLPLAATLSLPRRTSRTGRPVDLR